MCDLRSCGVTHGAHTRAVGYYIGDCELRAPSKLAKLAKSLSNAPPVGAREVGEVATSSFLLVQFLVLRGGCREDNNWTKQHMPRKELLRRIVDALRGSDALAELRKYTFVPQWAVVAAVGVLREGKLLVAEADPSTRTIGRWVRAAGLLSGA